MSEIAYPDACPDHPDPGPGCTTCDVVMMARPERWPLGPFLPIKRREREDATGRIRWDDAEAVALLMVGGILDHTTMGAPVSVWVGWSAFGNLDELAGRPLRDPLTYPDLHAVVADAWVVD